MSQLQPRVPRTCPAGFRGRYTVRPGDTMYKIAQLFRITLSQLIAANPHIPNPNLIIPGDVLCVPGLIPFPCCVVLDLRRPLPIGSSAAALVHTSFTGTQAVTVVATLYPPAEAEDFDIYTFEVTIPGVGGFGTQLFPTREAPPTWSGTVDIPTAATLTPDTRVSVRPANSRTGISGPILLEGKLSTCR